MKRFIFLIGFINSVIFASDISQAGTSSSANEAYNSQATFAKSRIFSGKNIKKQSSVGILDCLPEHQTQIKSTGILAFIKRMIISLQRNYPKEYTINLMWINKKPDINQNFIYPAKDETELKQNFINKILKWAQKNQESKIVLWFDSQMISKNAIDNTRTIIDQEFAKYRNKIAKVELRDIRDLSYVKKYPEVFSADIPLYFRVDLLRVIAAYCSILADKNLCFVYSDIDIEPLSKRQLFDRATLNNLSQYGIVMANQYNLYGFENSFQITTYNENLFKAIKSILIKLNILRAYNFLKAPKDDRWKLRCSFFQEVVYKSYYLMFVYFYSLKGLGVLKLDGADHNYDKNSDGLEPFVYLFTMGYTFIPNDPQLKFVMPKKDIEIPSTTSMDKNVF